jgi:hypothetical protein
MFEKGEEEEEVVVVVEALWPMRAMEEALWHTQPTATFVSLDFLLTQN